MILDEIMAKLEEVDPDVFYGSASRFDRSKPWDYIVFSRMAMRPNSRRTGYADVFEVAIVREGFIPDGLAELLISGMEEIRGVRVLEEDFRYDYAVKPGTSDTVEMLVLRFARARKRDV